MRALGTGILERFEQVAKVENHHSNKLEFLNFLVVLFYTCFDIDKFFIILGSKYLHKLELIVLVKKWVLTFLD